MLNQKEKFEGFAQVINKDAEKICAEIDSQVQSTMLSQMAEIEKNAADELERRLRAEENKTNTEINKRVCAIEAQRKKLVSCRRDQICREVLDAVGEKLKAFSERAEYDGYLERNLVRASQILGMNFNVSVRQQDEERVKAIAARMPEILQVKTDDSIKLGGFVADSSDGSVRADCTIDSELGQQREWFILNFFRTK